jgi:hypothetical protein
MIIFMITQKNVESVKSVIKKRSQQIIYFRIRFLPSLRLQQHSVLDSILLQTLLLKELFSFVFVITSVLIKSSGCALKPA